VGVAVGVGVAVRVGDGVGVAVGPFVGVGVAVGAFVGVGVAVGAFVGVGVGVGDGVLPALKICGFVGAAAPCLAVNWTVSVVPAAQPLVLPPVVEMTPPLDVGADQFIYGLPQNEETDAP
jgi:hypothetical protein